MVTPPYPGPLHLMAENGFGAIIDLLIENGARSNVRNKDGEIAFELGVGYRFANVVAALDPGYSAGATSYIPDAGQKAWPSHQEDKSIKIEGCFTLGSLKFDGIWKAMDNKSTKILLQSVSIKGRLTSTA